MAVVVVQLRILLERGEMVADRGGHRRTFLRGGRRVVPDIGPRFYPTEKAGRWAPKDVVVNGLLSSVGLGGFHFRSLLFISC